MADDSYTFGLGPQASHTIEAGDGKGGKVVVKNSTNHIIAVAISGNDAMLGFEILDVAHISKQNFADTAIDVRKQAVIARKKCHDPTRREMIAFLSNQDLESLPEDPAELKAVIREVLERDADGEHASIEVAIYWYALLNHGGQASNLYAALCASEYKPGPITKMDSEGPVVAEFYKQLCKEYD